MKVPGKIEEGMKDLPPEEPEEGVDVFEGTSPCDWCITPTETGILAVNSNSGATFEGTMVEFNKALRG